MSRSARLLFAMLLVLAASCQDRNEITGPVADGPAFGVNGNGKSSDGNGNGKASSGMGNGPAAQATGLSEAAPAGAELGAVARYLPGQAPQGAQVADATIGAAGGSLRLGDFEIVVPAGAVSADTHFQILLLPEAAAEKHAAARFFPHNVQFAVPVTLRVPHASTEAAGDPGAHVIWEDSGTWVEVPTTLTADGRLETTTDHFSLWATQRRLGLTIIGG